MITQADQAANRLFQEHRDGVDFTSISKEFGIDDIAAAYDVQDRLVPLLMDQNGQPCGYKIGLTSKAMQEMVGIDTPIAGVVLEDRLKGSHQEIVLSDYGRAGIEFEVGVRLGSDLGASPSRDDVAAAVESVCAAFEIIDDRNADYAALDLRSVLADNSWNAGAILGLFGPSPSDLAAVVGTVSLNGSEVDSGPGSAALGHPYEPIRWLAGHLATRGKALRKGDLILTGSLVKTMFPSPGDRFDFNVTGIGDVSVTFTG